MAASLIDVLSIESPEHYKSTDNKGFFKKFHPEEISTFCCDEKNIFLPDDSQKRYLHLPRDPRVNLDLMAGFEDRVEAEYVESIHKILECLRHLGMEQNSGPKTEIVCRRGLLSKIMILPYLVNQPKKHDVSITAIKYKNRIFLSTSGGGFKNYTAFNNIDDSKYNYTGHKFEQYVTKETLNSSVSLAKKGEPVNLGEAHYTCVRAKIGDNTLVYSGEVDCCDPRSDKAKYVECKTYYKVFHQDCLPNHRESFHMLKWWSQSVLVGVDMILCGVRKGDRVTLLHPYRLADLPGICKGQWEPEVCFSFLDKFLDFVQTSLADKPDDHRIVHRFYSNLTGRKSSGKSGIRYEVLADGSGAGFLPEWFCA